jgi:hypothetical protein
MNGISLPVIVHFGRQTIDGVGFRSPLALSVCVGPRWVE